MVRRSVTQFMPILAALSVYAVANVLLLLTALQLLDRLLLSAGVALVVVAVSSRVFHRVKHRRVSPEQVSGGEGDSLTPTARQ
ncbi:hypothetical protein FBY39_2345 [Microbacterium sp. SLBN-146]|nr:hypothetical protein FBY39_2345 [Microbacterium sp. SLBN-146]